MVHDTNIEDTKNRRLTIIKMPIPDASARKLQRRAQRLGSGVLSPLQPGRGAQPPEGAHARPAGGPDGKGKGGPDVSFTVLTFSTLHRCITDPVAAFAANYSLGLNGPPAPIPLPAQALQMLGSGVVIDRAGAKSSAADLLDKTVCGCLAHGRVGCQGPN
jgi:hypothetical protein